MVSKKFHHPKIISGNVKLWRPTKSKMKILKFSIIVSLLLFMTSCKRYYIPSDKGVVISIKKVENANKVTLKINASKTSDSDAYVTFLTNKQYNIDDVVYFTK